ncbi:MAG TPA: sugar phosphate isomerase/epimerase [Micromonosporaceae bacterium]
MELGCSTIGFGMVGLPEALERIAALGFGTVEIGVLGDFCPHLDPMAPAADTVARCGDLFANHGLRLTALNAAPRLYCADPRDLDQLQAVADRLLAIAAGLGCELILDVGEREPDLAPARTRAARLARETFRRGRDVHGVRVTVEAPHRGMTAETAMEAVDLLDEVGEDELRVTYDTSHATAGGIGAAAGLALIGDRVARVQLRDHIGDDVNVTPGDGEYEWPVLWPFLAAKPCPVTLELEFDGRLTPDAVAAETARARDFVRRSVAA